MMLPIAWQILARYLSLHPELAATVWRAMCRSKWHRPAALRRTIDLFGHIPMDSSAFLNKTCSAAELVAVLEDLVREGRLRRSQSTQAEEAIFARIAPTGEWK